MSFQQFSLDYTVLFNKLCDDLDIPARTRVYCLTRLKSEGISFLLVTLPKLNDLVLTALELGSLALVKHDVTCFRWKRNVLINFDKLLCELFDVDGSVKSAPCPVALWRIRQFSLYFYKLNLSFTENQIMSAESNFKKVEQDLADVALDENFVDTMRCNLESNYSFPKFSDVLSKCRPRSGPGTFSDNSRGKDPFYVKKATDSFCYGYLKGFEAIKGFFKLIPSQRNVLIQHEEDTNDCSEVLFVPKDSRGPRTIVREPYFALKAQMSFFDYFSRFFESATSRRINFTDQQVNRNLALHGSRTSDWATLDLKEASDRVSFKLVKQLCRNIPSLRYFLRFRTSEAKLPSGERIKLNKLAGMGSGLTFVWLALICHTSIATEISMRTGTPFKDASKLVYVYGDDIVVATCHVDYAKDALSKVGLHINQKKSFVRRTLGKQSCFRESCGGDYFAGNDVGITRFKMQNCGAQVERTARRITFSDNPRAISVANAHAAEMALNGHISVSDYIYRMIERTCGQLPVSRNPSSILTRVTRGFYSYEPDKTGRYSNISVICTRPRIIDVPDKISEFYNYASSLRSKVDLDLLNLRTSSTSQFELAVPRLVTLRRVSVSEIAL